MKRNLKNKLRMPDDELRVSKFATRHVTFLILITVIFLLTACSGSEEAHHDTYTCPMHPTVVSDRPGSCPVCGMDLVRKGRPGEDIKITEDLSKLLKSPNEIVVASVKTIRAEYRSVPVSVEATGLVTYDSRNIYTIPARTSGRLEKIFLKYNFQPVRKGQKVAEIYSPELVTAQRELLFLIENDSGNEQLIRAAKNKLQLLGLTRDQIGNVINSRQPQSTFAIFSPYNGYVITDDSAPVPSAGMSQSGAQTGGMNGMAGATSSKAAPQASPAAQPSATSPVREGSYVTTGETLFKIVNTTALRIELDIPGTEAAAIRVGAPVELMPEQDQSIKASVDFVQPFYSEGENFLKVRLYTRHSERLQIGQLVKASIKLDVKESLWVPREAVVNLGTQEVVFIRDREVLKPKSVTTGIRTNGLVEIRTGLASSDEIAANAQYLVDSESFIKPVE
ncbi:MAG: efflux RND transporter periplasmic adaptor subunit [Chryseosolibacter sp.]